MKLSPAQEFARAAEVDAASPPDAYQAFLEAKVELAKAAGFSLEPADLAPWMKEHAKLATCWALAGGRRAIFASFGLGKTSMQIEWASQVVRRVLARGAEIGRALIILPLGVRHDFLRDAAVMGRTVRFVQTLMECWGSGVYLTNNESVREGKVDPAGFDGVSLDEAAVLRGMGGTKLFRVLSDSLQDVEFRLLATAMPSPNEYVELLAYAEVLGVMDIGQAKTRFFKRNSEKADALTLHPHKEREFWLWVASWALFLFKPSDVGCSDEGYELPELVMRWHMIPAPPPYEDDEGSAGGEQGQLFRDSVAISVQNQAREKRLSMVARIARMAEICAADPDEHFILWHDLNDEARLIAQAMPDAFVLTGEQDDEVKEERILGFADGFFRKLAAKPVMAGLGCNFQRWCRRMIFAGVGFKFHDFLQAIHRVFRFGQTGVVEIDAIYAEAEQPVVDALLRRWAQQNEMVETMREIVREYGLSAAAMADELKRAMGAGQRLMAQGERYWLAHNDCVREVALMADDSVDLIVTSIPFSNLYEYSPNYADFGHTDNNAHFWAQMDFLIAGLLRVLKPGRDCCIHVKDRILSGKLTGLGFETLEPFSDECRAAFKRHGFAYLGTIVSQTDVVRENNQTYRLGHGLQLRDGSRMGVGVPEQVILFRKRVSDPSNGFADTPVVKKRPDYVDGEGRPVAYSREREKAEGIYPVEGTGYSRAAWQIDAHSFWRSGGDRLLSPGDWVTWENMGEAQKLWRKYCLDEVYDHAQHVLVGERFEAIGKLPAKFMNFPPHSWDPDWIWTDIHQMRSLNTDNLRKGADKHICPLPFDIVDRLIKQRSMPGELVFDPFAGLGTVPYRALKLGRCGAGVELAPDYWASAAKHLMVAEEESRPVPTLFDALEAGCCVEPEGVAA